MKTAPELKDRIRAARDSKGLTQAQVAERLSKLLGRTVLQLEISRWETGARKPQAASVAMLEKVVGKLR